MRHNILRRISGLRADERASSNEAEDQMAETRGGVLIHGILRRIIKSVITDAKVLTFRVAQL